MEANAYRAQYVDPPAFIGIEKHVESAAQANGRRYEAKVGRFLFQWAYENHYTVKDHPWIRFVDSLGRVKYAQPDYVLTSIYDDNLLLIEVKLRHTRDVIAQLHRYTPLIRSIHPQFKPSLVEICRYFDHSEAPMELLPALRPHSLPYAAVVFEPQEWTPTLN